MKDPAEKFFLAAFRSSPASSSHRLAAGRSDLWKDGGTLNEKPLELERELYLLLELV